MVTCIYLLSNVSQEHCTFILSSLAIIMQLNARSSTDIEARASVKHMYRTVDPVLSLLDIHPAYHSFLCCNQCYHIKWLDPTRRDSTPEFCSNVTPKGVCGGRVGRSPAESSQESAQQQPVDPARLFLYQSPKEYLAHLYARSDLHDYLYRDPCQTTSSDSSDIWDADVLQNFQYTDGSRFTASSDEGRLVFSLNMDGFNPNGNKQAGKQVSVGAIYMVCLNLPPEIRYNIENVYLVGIIPGPGHPSLDQINSLLEPLVDDFLDLWRTGCYLTRTFLRPFGLRVRCAIVPLICDLPAARQMSGFAGHGHTAFCSECDLKRINVNDIDPAAWNIRTQDEHRAYAKAWRDAADGRQRKAIYKTHGIRWSALLRLPYWDPTRFTLMDSMHAFYLRLFQHHVRNIWGMSVSMDDSDGPVDPVSIAPNENDMDHARFVLRHGCKARLYGLRKDMLRQLCLEAEISDLSGNREALATRLLHYVSDQLSPRGKDIYQILISLITKRIERNWWTTDDLHITKNGPFSNVVQRDTIRDGTTTDDIFWHASKTRIGKLIRSELIQIYRNHVAPSPDEFAVAKDWTNALLLKAIQKEACPSLC